MPVGRVHKEEDPFFVPRIHRQDLHPSTFHQGHLGRPVDQEDRQVDLSGDNRLSLGGIVGEKADIDFSENGEVQPVVLIGHKGVRFAEHPVLINKGPAAHIRGKIPGGFLDGGLGGKFRLEHVRRQQHFPKCVQPGGIRFFVAYNDRPIVRGSHCFDLVIRREILDIVRRIGDHLVGEDEVLAGDGLPIRPADIVAQV